MLSFLKTIDLSGSLVFIPSIGFAQYRWTDDLASQEDGQDRGGGVRIVHVHKKACSVVHS